MTHVAYVGRADIRVLDASDLKTLGVEGFRKTEFHRDTPVEIEDPEVVRVLVEAPQLQGEFKEVTPESEPTLFSATSFETQEETLKAQPQPGTGVSGTEGGTPKTSARRSTRGSTGTA